MFATFYGSKKDKVHTYQFASPSFFVVDINRAFKTCIYHVYAAIIGNSATQIAGKWAEKRQTKINSYDVAFSDASHKNFKK
jgi:hypothetical protein